MKRSFPIQPGSAAARLADHLRGTIGGLRFVRSAAAALLIASSAPPLFAQMELTGANFQPPSGESTVLLADFFLQQTNMASSFTPADAVVRPIKVTANGVLLPENRVTFTKTTDLPQYSSKTKDLPPYSCAVLLLVDNTLGKRNGFDQSIKDLIHRSLSNFIEAAAIPPFKLEIAIASDGNVKPLASMDSSKGTLQDAAKSIKFDGKSPSLYQELTAAISQLSQTEADRKFLVLYSDGDSNDLQNAASPSDVEDAAFKANIHICSIGFPIVAGSNTVQYLVPLAEKTAGAWVEASPQEQISSGRRHTPTQPDHSKLALPNDIESSLLKLMVSGGQIKVQLAGLNAPVDLSFEIQTQLNHSYTAKYKVVSLPAPPPLPSPTLTPVPTPTPTPAPPPSLLDTVKSWVISNVVIVSLVSAAILVGLILLIVTIRRRAAQHAAAEAGEPAQVTPADLESQPESVPLAWLESLDSDQRRYPISKTAVRIGRKADNDIVMKNDTISGHHAEILKRGSEFVIADLGASNQVLVGGKQVQRAALQDGDIIELGEVRLRFLQPQSADPDYRTIKI